MTAPGALGVGSSIGGDHPVPHSDSARNPPQRASGHSDRPPRRGDPPTAPGPTAGGPPTSRPRVARKLRPERLPKALEGKKTDGCGTSITRRCLADGLTSGTASAERATPAPTIECLATTPDAFSAYSQPDYLIQAHPAALKPSVPPQPPARPSPTSAPLTFAPSEPSNPHRSSGNPRCGWHTEEAAREKCLGSRSQRHGDHNRPRGHLSDGFMPDPSWSAPAA